jgi:WD40 repeat protein
MLEVPTCRELWRVRHPPGWSRSLSFSSDGKRLTMVGEWGDILCWDPATGKLRYQHKPLPSGYDYVLSPDGKVLAIEGNYGHMTLWQVDTGVVLGEIQGPKESVLLGMTFSPDNKLVAALGGDHALHMWEVQTRKEVRRPWVGDDAYHLAFSPDGKLIAAGGGANGLHVWEVATARKLHRWEGREAGLASLAFSPDGKVLVTGNGDGTVRLWGVPDGKDIWRIPFHETTSVYCVAYSPDGKLLATGTDSGALDLWEMPAGKKRRSLPRHTGWVNAAAFSPDGKVLASGSSLGEIHLWDATTGTEIRRLGPGDGPQVHQVAFAPDGKTLLASYGDNAIRLWDPNTGRGLWHLKDAGALACTCFTADGRALTSASDGMIRQWDAATGKELRRLRVHPREIRGMSFSPDGRTVTVAADDTNGIISFWDFTSGRRLRGLGQGDSIPTQPASFVAFSLDGRLLASASDTEDRVCLWEVLTGHEIGEFNANEGLPTCLAFAPDGRTLAAGSSSDRTAIWDVTGRMEGTRLAPLDLKPPQLDALWSDLAARDAARAHRAQWALVAASRQALAFLSRKLKPIPSADAQRLRQLLADLGSDDFATREQATQVLANMEDGAETFLRSALHDKPSPEVHRRIEYLLEPLDAPVLTGPRLRALRAAAVLEYIGSPEARALLERLAGGAPGASRTRQAKASLERLARRNPPGR